MMKYAKKKYVKKTFEHLITNVMKHTLVLTESTTKLIKKLCDGTNVLVLVININQKSYLLFRFKIKKNSSQPRYHNPSVFW